MGAYEKVCLARAKGRPTSKDYIKNIFEEQELDKNSTVGNFPTDFYFFSKTVDITCKRLYNNSYRWVGMRYMHGGRYEIFFSLWCGHNSNEMYPLW